MIFLELMTLKKIVFEKCLQKSENLNHRWFWTKKNSLKTVKFLQHDGL